MAKVEFGKYYRTETGEKIGPMLRSWGGGGSIFSNGDSLDDIRAWDSSGACDIEGHAVVAEWGSPVITETVNRIVPGVYGRIVVETNCAGQFCFHVDRPHITWQKHDLSEAIATLTAIRGAL